MGFWSGFGYIWDNCAVGIVHALSRTGVKVYGIDLHVAEPHEVSKPYVRNSSGLDFKQTCEELNRVRKRFNQNPVLFLSGEKPAAMLAEHSETLSEYFNFHWTKPTKLYRVIDKSRTPALCRETGITCPQTYVTSPEEDLIATAKDFVFPCIIKPNLINRDWNVRDAFPGRHLIVRSWREIVGFYDRFPWMLGRTIWQELIEGDDSDIFQCTALINRSGNVAAAVCVRKLRQTPKGHGSMSYGRTEWNNEVVSRTMKFVKTLGITGFVSAEFKYEEATGKYYFIELNPRLPAYNAFFPLTNVNLANLCYADLTGLDAPESSSQREHVYCMTFGNISSREPIRFLKDAAHSAASWRTFLECQIKPHAITAIYKRVKS